MPPLPVWIALLDFRAPEGSQLSVRLGRTPLLGLQAVVYVQPGPTVELDVLPPLHVPTERQPCKGPLL